MQIELSMDNQNSRVNQIEEQAPRPEDTQRISGSQVATAFASIEKEKIQKQDKRTPVLAISMSAVLSIVAVYMVVVLAI